MSEPFLGEIKQVGFNFAPRGWAFCDGQLLQISQYSALFSLLGTTYGGDGRTTFGLPDLRGRVGIHVGTGPGLSQRRWGESGGTEDVTLTTSQVPSHTHSLQGTAAGAGDTKPAAGLVLADADENVYGPQPANVALHSSSIGNAGGGLPHTNVQPYLGTYFVIALTGIFPSRS